MYDTIDKEQEELLTEAFDLLARLTNDQVIEVFRTIGLEIKDRI